MDTLTRSSRTARRSGGLAGLARLVGLLAAAASVVLAGGCNIDKPRQVADDALPQAPAHPAQLYPGGRAGVALVLSSGGLRGLAQLGVLRALQRHGLQPDLVVGSSVGALVGAAYAAGLADDPLGARTLPAALDPFGSWFVTPAQRSLAYEAFAAQVLGSQRIEQFPMRFVAVATERRDGCIVLFGRGDGARAVSASSALPGALAPVSIRGQTFADGGLAAPLPVRVARDLGARFVIAVDTTFHAEPVVPDGVLDSVFHAGMVMSRNLALPDRAAADLLIDPQLPPVAEVTLANHAALVDAGERAALALMPQIQALFARAAAAAASAAVDDDRRAATAVVPPEPDLPYCAVDPQHRTAAQLNRSPTP